MPAGTKAGFGLTQTPGTSGLARMPQHWAPIAYYVNDAGSRKAVFNALINSGTKLVAWFRSAIIAALRETTKTEVS